jgi:hypothetical protein
LTISVACLSIFLTTFLVSLPIDLAVFDAVLEISLKIFPPSNSPAYYKSIKCLAIGAVFLTPDKYFAIESLFLFFKYYRGVI